MSTLLSTDFAAAVARQLGALVAPVFSYGYKSQPRSGGGDHRTGTTSLSANTLMRLVEDVAGSFLRQGFRNVVVLNGHFENYQFIYEGIDQAITQARDDGLTSRGVLMSYWDFVDDETLQEVFPDGFLGWDIEHGGVLETSLMLLLHPEKVEMDRVVDHPPAEVTAYDIFPDDPARTPASGCLSSAVDASAEKGRLLFDAVRGAVSQALATELGITVSAGRRSNHG